MLPVDLKLALGVRLVATAGAAAMPGSWIEEDATEDAGDTGAGAYRTGATVGAIVSWPRSMTGACSPIKITRSSATNSLKKEALDKFPPLEAH
jgi:hypothetical protein